MKDGEFREISGIAIIIGDEVLLGDVSDANTSCIGKTLLGHSFRLREVITVGDDVEHLVRALRYASSSGDFVITAGGLGPTDDDCTCKAVSEAFGLNLVTDASYRKAFKGHVEKFGIEWRPEFENMVRLPSGAVKLALDKPVAGFKLTVNGVPLYCLPGVPHELEYLLSREVIPDLDRIFDNRLRYKRCILRVHGIQEWEIEKKIKTIGLLEDERISIGYLPRPGGETWVTVLVKDTSEDRATSLLGAIEGEILRVIGRQNISGKDDDGRIEVVIGRILRSRGWKLAVSESCTGGLLAETIVSVPGASDYFERGYVVYSNESKSDVLGIDENIIKKFGAVSEEVAREMVLATRKRASVNVAISTTGIAGPTGGSKEKPVGTVFIGCCVEDNLIVKCYLFSGARRDIQTATVYTALKLAWEMLSS